MRHNAETDRDIWEAQANHLYEANCRMKRQIEDLKKALDKQVEYADGLRVSLAESRENDRIAMSWIHDFMKAANFNGTYPEFVEWIEARHRGE